MVTPLRAYLMLRGSGEWTVTVYQQFEELLSAWLARPEPDVTSGVMHVGFDRPPSQTFDTLVQSHSGRLLLTISAKFSLPPSHTASEGEVGRVNDLAIFIGARGWGYIFGEDEVPAQRFEPTGREAREFRDWVARFVAAHPEDADMLKTAGLFDDYGYLDHESELPSPLRKELGLYRLDEQYSGGLEDPCGLSRAAPPWFRRRAFEGIELSVRVSNVLTAMGIETVADLGDCSSKDLMAAQNFGRKSLRDLSRSLRTALETGPSDLPADVATIDLDRPLIECIEQSLLKYEGRERDIIRRRMGLGCDQETLQEIADRYNISRERVRQVEAKVTRRLIKEEVWDDVLGHRLTALTDHRTFPLPLNGIEAIDPWFGGVGAEATALRYLLANVSQSDVRIVDIEGIAYVGRLSRGDWDTAVGEARRFLAAAVERSLDVTDCKSHVAAILPDECSEFRDLLWDFAIRDAQFVNENGALRLVSFGRGAESIVEAILQEADRPLHFSEIAVRASNRAGREIDQRRAHNAASQIGILLGRGVYGLRKHIPLDDAEIEGLGDAAAQIIAEGPDGRQWHSSELLALVAEGGNPTAAPVDKYVLDYALRSVGGLERLGRLVWAASRSNAAAAHRIDIRQAVIASLDMSGGPLTTEEIRMRVDEARGTDTHFQIFAHDPIIKVAPGTWGLNDRDLPIKRSDQAKFCESIYLILQKRGRGIHRSEIEGSPTLETMGLNSTSFFCLAGTDPRMRVSPGEYLYLQEWGDARRLTIKEAVEDVLGQSNEPLSFEVIAKGAATLVGRSLNSAAVSASLVALDAVYDASSSTWSRLAPVADDEVAAVDA